MSSQKQFYPLVIGIAIATGILIGDKLNMLDTSRPIFASNSKKEKLNRLIDLIDHQYVDEVDTDSIVDVTVTSILSNLDPHSTYIPKEALQKSTESMKGDFVGIGVSFYSYKDTVTVIRPLEGGPSYKGGIKAGDRIIEADGMPIFGKNWSDDMVINKLRGKNHTTVDLTVYRPSEDTIIEFKIDRGNVPIVSVDAAYMLTDELGYIKINRFAETTFNEFKTALNILQAKGIRKLVLDLRNNPGGFMHIAEQIADEFLEDNKLILFTKNKQGKIVNSYATDKGAFENGEIFVLINENSASASEIIAGALQDNDKGIIVGRRSFGKGLIQREMALGDGTAIRLTVSRYYTPTGRSIQRSYKNGNKDYYHEYYKRRTNGELSNKNSIEIADSLKFLTPKGKIVYGGGGIIPDEFVATNKKMENQTIDFILSSGFLEYFIFEKLDKDRSILQNMVKDDFVANYKVTDKLLEQFKSYYNSKSRYQLTFAAYKEEVKLCLKAKLAEQLFGKEAFTEIINNNDTMLLKIKELIQE